VLVYNDDGLVFFVNEDHHHELHHVQDFQITLS